MTIHQVCLSYIIFHAGFKQQSLHWIIIYLVILQAIIFTFQIFFPKYFPCLFQKIFCTNMIASPNFYPTWICERIWTQQICMYS